MNKNPFCAIHGGTASDLEMRLQSSELVGVMQSEQHRETLSDVGLKKVAKRRPWQQPGVMLYNKAVGRRFGQRRCHGLDVSRADIPAGDNGSIGRLLDAGSRIAEDSSAERWRRRENGVQQTSRILCYAAGRQPARNPAQVLSRQRG